MKRLWMIAAALLLLCWPMTVSAASTPSFSEQWEESGAGALWDGLPIETRMQLEALGITEQTLTGSAELKPDAAWKWLLALLRTEWSDPVGAGLTVLGVVLLCALVGSMRHLSENDGVRTLFQSISTLAVCGFLLASLAALLTRVCDAVESSLVFMSSFVPVYAGLLAAGGYVTATVSYQTILLWVGELLMVLLGKVILPVLMVALAINTVGSVSPAWRLQQLGNGISKTCTWGMGIVSSFFTGLLSFQTVVGAAADTVSGRAIRFSIANLIPVVGGTLSEAMLTIKGCLSAVRSTVGMFGIAVVAILLLPPILSCVGWNLLLSLSGYTAEVFSLDSVASLTRSVGTVLKTLMALMVMCGVFLIVAITVLMRVGGTG
ncbi:MAG: hypothetical protein IJC17_05265 [Clostridia bacterium]|nr:hypothetical protein [Clostridia bacterium]